MRVCSGRSGAAHGAARDVGALAAAQVGDALLTPAREVVRRLPARPPPPGVSADLELWREDGDHVMALARETLADGKSVLIFCATKRDCQATARQAARLLGAVAERWVPGAAAAAAGSQVTRASLVDDLRRVPGGGLDALAAVLPSGIAFHHSGAPPLPCPLPRPARACGVIAGAGAAVTKQRARAVCWWRGQQHLESAGGRCGRRVGYYPTLLYCSGVRRACAQRWRPRRSESWRRRSARAPCACWPPRPRSRPA